MTETDPIPYDLIGRLTVRFGLVDFIAHSLAWELLGDATRGAAVTEGLGVDRVAELITRLAQTMEPIEMRDEVIRSAVRIRELAEARNGVTHSLWLNVDGEAVARRLRPLLRQLGANEVLPPEPGIPVVLTAFLDAEALIDTLIDVLSRLQQRHIEPE